MFVWFLVFEVTFFSAIWSLMRVWKRKVSDWCEKSLRKRWSRRRLRCIPFRRGLEWTLAVDNNITKRVGLCSFLVPTT